MAQIASFQAFAREVGEVDLPPGRFALLTLIGRNPGISQTVLSRAAGRDKSTLTPALRDLKRRGLIARDRLESDRRSYHLTLTPDGEAMLQRLTECAARHDRKLDRVVGPRDRARLLRTVAQAWPSSSDGSQLEAVSSPGTSLRDPRLRAGDYAWIPVTSHRDDKEACNNG